MSTTVPCCQVPSVTLLSGTLNVHMFSYPASVSVRHHQTRSQHLTATDIVLSAAQFSEHQAASRACQLPAEPVGVAQAAKVLMADVLAFLSRHNIQYRTQSRR